MSRVKTELIDDIRRKTGVDAACIVEYLYSMGTLDDNLVRRHVVKIDFIKRLVSCDLSERAIQEDVGEEYGLTRRRVHQLVGALGK